MDNSPGGKALNVMKNYEKSCIEFKKPNLPKNKPKPKILTEEKYIEELSKILERDFFPDLQKLKAQLEYLDAVNKNDIIKLREIYAKYSDKKLNSIRKQSPATFETPESNVSFTPLSQIEVNDEENTKNLDTEKNVTSKTSLANKHTLNTFLNKYTSEDNASFQEIMEAADAKLKQKFSTLYTYEAIAQGKLQDALSLPSIEDQFNGKEKTNQIETWSYKNKNYIMYVPDGVELTKEEKMNLINGKQEICYANTRLNKNPFNENQNKETITELAKTQAKNLTGKIGVDGNILQTTNTPQVGGFSFVKTPSPCPGETYSPLMTWGEIEGTPFRLDGSDTPIRSTAGPSFRINEASRRETIALELANKAGERMREQKQKALDTARKNIGSPYIRSSAERLANMSPAAKRLATMKLGLSSSSITPSPQILNKTPSPMVRRKIPSINKIQPQKSETKIKDISPSSVDLTDSNKTDLTSNLLKIPFKRPKAADFF